MKELLEFARLGNSKKIVLMVSVLDLLILIFMDYLLVENIGINVRLLFLNSFHNFLLNIFTAEFFTLIIGFVVLFVAYYFFFPLLFPIIFYRIMAIIYGLIIITFIWIPSQLYHLFSTQKWVVIDDSMMFQLKWYKMIKENDDGNILPDKRTDSFLEIYNDINGDGKIEDFFVNLLRTTSTISLIAVSLNCTFYMVLIFGLISIIPLAFASAFFNLFLNRNELTRIINKLKPNLTIEQLNLLENKPTNQIKNESSS